VSAVLVVVQALITDGDISVIYERANSRLVTRRFVRAVHDRIGCPVARRGQPDPQSTRRANNPMSGSPERSASGVAHLGTKRRQIWSQSLADLDPKQG